MKQELQDKLYKDHPLIFGGKDLDCTNTCMCWGIACGSGWYQLLDALCWTLDNHYANQLRNYEWKVKHHSAEGRWEMFKYACECTLRFFSWSQRSCWRYNWIRPWVMFSHLWVYFKECWGPLPDKPEPVVAAQVKEKFGTLCFYTNGADEASYGAIHMAEVLSGMTCEVCGAPGKSRGGSWISTLCDSCCSKEDGDEIPTGN